MELNIKSNIEREMEAVILLLEMQQANLDFLGHEDHVFFCSSYGPKQTIILTKKNYSFSRPPCINVNIGFKVDFYFHYITIKHTSVAQHSNYHI